uniref:Uncharacterized protein LOC105630867 n=1 Tax=Rhizophora mucronata TaxID=61149 RepID=A0A2P2P9U4_RHIMU
MKLKMLESQERSKGGLFGAALGGLGGLFAAAFDLLVHETLSLNTLSPLHL